jgi:hypothetical protein
MNLLDEIAKKEKIKMKKKLLAGLAIGLFLVGGVSIAQAALIQDGDFVAWSSFSFVTDDPFVAGPPPNNSNGNAVTVATGGNPGAFLQATHTMTYGDTIWTGGIKTDFSYNTAIDGAIDFLSVTADLLHPSAGATAWQLVIQQEGQRYYSFPFGAFSHNNSWLTAAASNLVATDFDTNPWAGNGGIIADGNQPDFGSAAMPLQFGFMFGNGLSSYGTLTNTLGLDNFSVSTTSSPVPLPPAIFLFGTGLAGLAGIRFKRKKQ